jgi:Uma2 family endonuclease
MSVPFRELLREAEGINVRLEMMNGIPVWEASPAFFHQWELKRIENSIRPLAGALCACVSVADVLFTFANASFKRPDIAVLCQLPNPLETEEALNIIPMAVIEVVSKNYEYKDLVLAPPFYLENGVKDVIVFDPRSKVVLHHRREWNEPKQLQSPIRLELECGCEVTV